MKSLHNHLWKCMKRRNGYTLLELVVAMTVLGIALTGLFPLMVMQSRTIESLELQYTSQGDGSKPVFRSELTAPVDATARVNYGTWYLIPSADPWARKIGGAAAISKNKPSAATAVLADNAGSCTFAPDAAWTAGTSDNAYAGDYRTHALQATPSDTATWTFENLAQGLYYVIVTWPASPSLTLDAKYEVYQGSTLKAQITSVNQTVTPTSDIRTNWKLLTTQAFVDAGSPSATLTVSVKLYASSTGAVAADAVQLVPAAQVLSVDKSFNSEQVMIRVKLGGS